MNPNGYAEASRILEERRQRNEAEMRRRTEECRSGIPRMAEIFAQLTDNIRLVASAAMNGDEQALAGILKRNSALFSERSALLAAAGKPADYLDEIFTCPLCRDTGTLEDGSLCECFKKLAAAECAKRLNEDSPLSLSSFDDFSLSYYSDEAAPGEPCPPKKQMRRVLSRAKDYAASFSMQSPSLLFWGNPGLGKTHLALSIAREVTAKNYGVVYLPATRLFNRLERERFSRGEYGATLDTVLSCDFLVLDDLGTELSGQYIQSCLYEIINTRLLSGRPTIISTNLKLQELREKYPARIISRLLGEYEDILFTGSDIRLLKKYGPD